MDKDDPFKELIAGLEALDEIKAIDQGPSEVGAQLKAQMEDLIAKLGGTTPAKVMESDISRALAAAIEKTGSKNPEDVLTAMFCLMHKVIVGLALYSPLHEDTLTKAGQMFGTVMADITIQLSTLRKENEK